MSALLGPLLVLVFAASQAFRDVYFGNVFQGVDFFAIIFLAFSLSTVIFTVVALIRSPGEFGKLRADLAAVIGMNVTTAVAWSCYFFALTHLEPSIVNTIHSGMGPLTVVAMGACGLKLAQTNHVSRSEYLGYAGIALSLAGLWWVVLAGFSGLPGTNRAIDLAGLALLLVSGASITVSMLYSKRLHDRGVNAEVVTAVRYLALIVLAGGIVASKGGFGGISGPVQLATLSVTTTALIVLPLFALQVGIAHTRPLPANVIRALGPVCIFALEQVDGRTHYSAPTLACILIYSAAVIYSNAAHGWRDQRTGASAPAR